ncbi:hypothetical protein [Bifidobacterium miconisargentati]|uniref:hypothetical protein n=1 Tax=Bifidobacterium miconisargentati TaxID=2834437 RepID=UPI001BDC480F|nr:hypothetical protein [Bifidobacterium miconisargentati]
MSLLDDLGGGFRLGGATLFERLRAARIPDAYNPMQSAEDWEHPDVLELRGALASSSSTRTPDVLDNQTTSVAYLTVDNPMADVRIGDRIRAKPDDGRMWEVSGFPSRDVNAFTGWRPTLEIQLNEWRG